MISTTTTANNSHMLSSRDSNSITNKKKEVCSFMRVKQTCWTITATSKKGAKHEGISWSGIRTHKTFRIKTFFRLLFFHFIEKLCHGFLYHSSYTRHFVVLSCRTPHSVYHQIAHFRINHCMGMTSTCACVMCINWCDIGMALPSQVRLCIQYSIHTWIGKHRDWRL